METGVEAKRSHAFGICSCVDGAAAGRGNSAYGDAPAAPRLQMNYDSHPSDDLPPSPLTFSLSFHSLN